MLSCWIFVTKTSGNCHIWLCPVSRDKDEVCTLSCSSERRCLRKMKNTEMTLKFVGEKTNRRAWTEKWTRIHERTHFHQQMEERGESVEGRLSELAETWAKYSGQRIVKEMACDVIWCRRGSVCRHTCQEERIKGKVEQNVNGAVALWSGAKLYIKRNNEPLQHVAKTHI